MENQKKICNSCKTEINENDNFCSKCGEPLTDLAKEYVQNQFKNAQLKLVLKLVDEVKDENTLNVLKQYIEKLGK